MRFELLLLDAVDSSLGRVDHESLPQLSLMEMVVKEIANKDDICGDADEPKEIKEWKGVEIEDGEVVAIMWGECDLKGSVCLEWLPSSVKEFAVTWNRLTGTVNLASLPTSLKGLELGGNAFTAGSAMPRHAVRTTCTMKPLCTYRKWRGLRCSERSTGLSRAAWSRGSGGEGQLFPC
ncbi:hypothetical protein XU18_3506 [Perkinsela sp. CCAP 1560/4]|nr:hypothetical protein XU18_3506 [Perkinsela sp. CCAP 1560/4]|eukprot:KNH05535.1 hypothetical protein XU18_3506 [Perkinsela sp. CCAP 1560/4]